MAYPFIQWPTFEHVRERFVNEFDCTYHSDELTLSGAKVGNSGVKVGELRRSIDGRVFRYATIYPDDYRLAPSVISSICTQLRVNLKNFGMTLEEGHDDG